MNKILFIALALVCSSSTVMAQSNQDQTKKQDQTKTMIKGDAISCACCTRGGAESTSPIILALDLDKDGQISAIELKNAAQSLAALDDDSDGVISRKEMHASSKFVNVNARTESGKDGRQLGVTRSAFCSQVIEDVRQEWQPPT